jgi:hypothetical protein
MPATSPVIIPVRRLIVTLQTSYDLEITLQAVGAVIKKEVPKLRDA